MMSFLLGFLGVIFAIIVLILGIYFFLVYKFNQLGFKGLNLFKIKDEIEENSNMKPKQVSGMTKLLLPRIMKDFSDFDINHLYLLTEKSIRSILNSIENKDISVLEDKDFNLINKKLKLQLEDLINSDIIYKYDDIAFHKHALKSYSNNDGIATIEVSSSLEYFYQKEKNGKKLENGSMKKQVRYITKFVYIVDSSAYEKDINVYGINCPNCGAVIDTLKSNKCKYCGSGLNIQVVNLLKCWKLIDCKEN